MNNNKNEVRLYNVLFPLWMTLLFPQFWLLVIPGNFLIDSLVLLICMAILKIPEKKQCYKKHIFKIFAFGILSDIIGSIFILIMMLVFWLGNMGDEIYLTIPALFISAIMIFVFNYFFTFKKFDKALRFKLAITFAIVTAPYTFLVPSSWIYNF